MSAYLVDPEHIHVPLDTAAYPRRDPRRGRPRRPRPHRSERTAGPAAAVRGVGATVVDLGGPTSPGVTYCRHEIPTPDLVHLAEAVTGFDVPDAAVLGLGVSGALSARFDAISAIHGLEGSAGPDFWRDTESPSPALWLWLWLCSEQ